MWPIFLEIPGWLLMATMGLSLGATLAAGKDAGRGRILAGAALGLAAGLGLGAWNGWLAAKLPVYGYGTLILCGFLLGVVMARSRCRLIGVDPEQITDMGVLGVVSGLAGARLFFVIDHWDAFNPLGPRGPEALYDVFKLWEGGLVFYGAFLAVIPAAAWFCRRYRIPVLPFLDLLAPCLIAGQALGRIGCLMRGCCWGRTCDWGLVFGPDSPPYADQVLRGGLPLGAAHSLPVHPTQLYGALSAALTAGFLYSFWPRRRYDGQVLGLMLVMAGTTRFFEEFLRADTGAAFPHLSATLSIAQWIGLGLMVLGAAWILYWRRRRIKFQAAAHATPEAP
ncbi:MAG: prolipoprotein diacylglyceryl transferase [Planctomycetota bacterium]|nr:prolipoprotein diacylglyceryl transferase [Planctomycetota bacterium]